MSLLSIAKRALAATGWDVPAAIVGNSDKNAVQVMALVQDELEALSESHDWPHLEVEYPFVTVPGQSEYLWPTDFRKVSPIGMFNTSDYTRVRSSVNADEWNRRKYELLGPLDRIEYRVFASGTRMGIQIAPSDAASNLVALYYTNKYAMSSDGLLFKDTYELDTDVSRIPERLVGLGLRWRFRRMKGLDFSVELAEYNSTISQQFAATTAAPVIPIGGRRTLWECEGLSSGYVPNTGFGV